MRDRLEIEEKLWEISRDAKTTDQTETLGHLLSIQCGLLLDIRELLLGEGEQNAN
jgi:hypothetical protein